MVQGTNQYDIQLLLSYDKLFTYSGFPDLATYIKKQKYNALANQNAALDQSQTRFVCMLEHEFESRFEICVLIGQHITSAF